MDSKEFQEKANCALKSMCDGKKCQSFILCWIEFLFPFLFVLSLLGCIVFTCQLASAAFSFSFFSGIKILIGSLLASVTVVLITFYLVYALKAIKDATVGENSCCCSDDKCETKPASKDVKNAENAKDTKSEIQKVNKKAEEVKPKAKPVKRTPAANKTAKKPAAKK